MRKDKPCKHSESRKEGSAQVFYKALIKTLTEKYEVEQRELEQSGLDPSSVSAEAADRIIKRRLA